MAVRAFFLTSNPTKQGAENMKPRMPKNEFTALLKAIRALPTDKRRAVAYWARLAYDRQQYGSYVYIHAGAPPCPDVIRATASTWGRSQNSNHSDVTINAAGYANFAAGRCWQIVEAAR
jgi:hypothetical protein